MNNYTNSIQILFALFYKVDQFWCCPGPRPSLRTLLFTTFISLRKQPTFGKASTGFPAKKKQAQKFHTGMSHYPDLGSDASSIWNFCAHFSDIINGGETCCSFAKCRQPVYSGYTFITSQPIVDFCFHCIRKSLIRLADRALENQSKPGMCILYWWWLHL